MSRVLDGLYLVVGESILYFLQTDLMVKLAVGRMELYLVSWLWERRTEEGKQGALHAKD